MTALAVLVVETTALTCQFAQHTDPRFPLVYFSVDSAVLAAVAAAAALLGFRWRYLPALWVAAAVGVTVSGVVFAAVIAPASPTGTWLQPHDDYWVRTATILMHGLAPPLVITATTIGRTSLAFVSSVAFSYPWPVTYLIVVVSLGSAGQMAVPYPFLQPEHLGWSGVAIVIVALAALTGLIGAALHGLQRLAHRGDP